MAVPFCSLQLRVVSEPEPAKWSEALQQKLHIDAPEGYKSIFAHLIAGISEQDFFDQVFERQCVHFSRNLQTVAPAAPSSKKRKAGDSSSGTPSALDLFSDAAFLDTVERHGLHATNNVTITKFMNKKRIDYAAVADDDEGPLTRAALSGAFKAGFTVQFYQPQRFADSLYKINAAFEHRLGSLAGASVYLTPPRSQGLEPHHDDVEVFVLQTQGSKKWCLYLDASASLPEAYAKGLPPARLKGKVEVTLHAGDVLYLPRGAIHEAAAQEAFSTHVTISVCQHHSYKHLLLSMMPRLCSRLFAADEGFRRSLPPRLSRTLGSGVGLQEGSGGVSWGSSGAASGSGQAGEGEREGEGEGEREGEEGLERTAARAALLAKVQGFAARLVEMVTSDALDGAADDFLADFVENRLPPPDAISSPAPGPGPGSLGGWGEGGVRLVDAACLHVQVEDEEEEEGGEGERAGEGEGTGEGKVLALYLAAANDRLRHMGHPPGPEEGGGDEDDDEEEEDDDEDEGGEGEEGEEEDPSARFPLRFAPLVAALQLPPPRLVTAEELARQGLGLREDEVRAALAELGAKGFLVR